MRDDEVRTVEYCVEVNTKTGESRVLYSEEEKGNDEKLKVFPIQTQNNVLLRQDG
jgi:hypothetical protein